MKKRSIRRLCLVLALVMVLGISGAASAFAAETWTVTCPWAPDGVASLVSQKAASLSTEYSKDITLVAEAIKGDAATVNTWVLDNEANDPSLVFVGEGLLSITATMDPAKMQFGYEDFVFVENLYSSVFVLSADAKLEIEGIEDLQAYVAEADEITVACNGATGSEAFLAAALFGSMEAGERLKIVPYQSAAEAAQAVSRGETQFAVSHQSQILETYNQGGVTVVCAFDEGAIENGPLAGVEGVGEYGYPYFRNRCFIMARAGTDEETVAALKQLYDDILADEEVVEWLHDTMLLEVDTMTVEDVEAHVENVTNIVNEYIDIVQPA